MSGPPNLFYEMLDQLIAAEDNLFVPKVKIIASPSEDQARLFFEITAFRERHGRAPEASSRSPEEMRLGIRLNVFRNNPDTAGTLQSYDQFGLLGLAPSSEDDEAPDSLDDLIDADDELLITPDDHIFDFRATPLPALKSEPDAIADRVPCKDFDKFETIFKTFTADISSGALTTTPTSSTCQVTSGDMFIIDGQLAYIAEVGSWMARGEKKDARLRIIYDNGTESDHLLRSFGKALYRADNSRRVQAPKTVRQIDEKDLPVTGRIYVARTLSGASALVELKHHIVKIGSTTGKAADRIAGAVGDPTFLLAEAMITAEYDTHGVHPQKIEGLLHRFFAKACVNLHVPDRFGKQVDPREWFFVTPDAVEQAICLLTEKRLHLYCYEVNEDRIVLK